MSSGVRIVAAMVCCILLSGCGGLAGLAVGAVGRTAGTGSQYAIEKANMPPVALNLGRVFFYAPRRGGTLFDTVSLGTGATYIFTVDNEVCYILGSTYMYKDLQPGIHNITSDNVKQTWSELTGEYNRGRYAYNVELMPGESKYIRLGIINDNGYHLAPQAVDMPSAETELKDLPIDTHFVSKKCHNAKITERSSSRRTGRDPL